MANTITVASPPSTTSVALRLLAAQAAQTGVVTDINPGSQVRTLAEGIGQVAEMQGVMAQAIAFQAMVYSAWTAFGITPNAATYASVSLTFQTAQYGSANAPGASMAVTIPAGTIVQTTGGVQFSLDSAVTLAAGSSSVTGVVTCLTAGAAGNVNPGTITTLAGSVNYPLYVYNASAATGGADAETPAQTMARYSAVVASLAKGTPLGVQGAVIGVANGAETVKYATVYEPWKAEGTQNAGYTVIVDNGSGTASSGLLSAVGATLDGDAAAPEEGYRPAGVPYSVQAVDPVPYSVAVSGVLSDSSTSDTVTSAVVNAISTYQSSLAFGDAITLSGLIAQVANVVAGYATSLTVALFNSGGAMVNSITVPGTQRGLLSSTTVNFD